MDPVSVGSSPTGASSFREVKIMAMYRAGQAATVAGKRVVITDLIHDEDDEYEAVYEVTDPDGNSTEAHDSDLTDVV